jgi:hypothetical protein
MHCTCDSSPNNHATKHFHSTQPTRALPSPIGVDPKVLSVTS